MRRRRLWNRVPAGLVGTLALIAAVESAIGRKEFDWALPWSLDWQIHGRSAEAFADGQDLLIFGDSIAKFGLIPRLIDEERGGRSYNLALCNGQATTSYFLLRRIVDSGAKPSAIVVDFTPHMLARGPWLNARNWPELLTAPEAWELSRATGDPGLLGRVLAAGAVPSIRLRGELRDAIADAIGGVPYRHNYGTLRFLRNWRVNRGANLMPPIAFDQDPVAWYRGTLTSWSVDDTNLIYLDKFMRLAGREGIAVYWLLAPPTRELQEGLERSGLDADHERFVRQVASQHPHVRVLDARHAGYPQSAHAGDPLHPSLGGAITLSVDVGRAIRADEAGENRSAWVELPFYRDLGDVDEVEDIEESRIALDDYFRGLRR